MHHTPTNIDRYFRAHRLAAACLFAVALSLLQLSVPAHATPATPTIKKQVSNQSKPVLSGTADPMAASSLSIAGAHFHLKVDKNGQWSLDLAEDRPTSGTYRPDTSQPLEIKVTSTDATGNLSHDLTELELRIQLDADNDGIADLLEQQSTVSCGVKVDTDADGLPDYQDTDADGDGLADALERGTVALSGSDSDLDNIDDAIDISLTRGLDQNGNGIDDAMEPVDSDQDGLADFADSDSDNDGLSDAVEGNLDTDADGIQNYLDTDSDNDGIPDTVERDFDSDADSVPDYLDPDSDNDGIQDAQELGDRDSDQIPDRLDADADNDTLPDLLETAADFDGDGVPNYLDWDSDNDGIADRYEAYSRAQINEQAHYRLTGQNYPAIAADTDQDGLPDFTDLDSDNYGLPDVRENLGLDSDYNGIVDTQQAGGTPVFGYAQAQTLQPLRDSDHDRIADFRDLDSDNDGLSDLHETYGGPEQQSGTLHVFVDMNQDGLDDLIALKLRARDNADSDYHANYLDLDSDNNGFSDLAEAGFVDRLGDGIVDSLLDSDRDGIPDSVDVTQTGGNDLNADGIDDASNAIFLGTGDADRDGIADSVDPDANGDGKVDHLLAPQALSVPIKDKAVDATKSAPSAVWWLVLLLLLLLTTGYSQLLRNPK